MNYKKQNNVWMAYCFNKNKEQQKNQLYKGNIFKVNSKITEKDLNIVSCIIIQ